MVEGFSNVDRRLNHTRGHTEKSSTNRPTHYNELQPYLRLIEK